MTARSCGNVASVDKGNDVLEPNHLVVGGTYFMVTYPDATMQIPVILTYRFLGKDPTGVQEEEPGSHYYFRYLPAFQNDHDDNVQVDEGWEAVFPGAFTGWGERVPTSFAEDKVRGLSTLDGLIEELNGVRVRNSRNE